MAVKEALQLDSNNFEKSNKQNILQKSPRIKEDVISSSNIGRNYQMTLNILESDSLDMSLVTNDLDTEEKRVAYLKELRLSVKRNGGKLDYHDPIIFIEVLSQAFIDTKPTTRCIAMDLLSECIPSYGSHLDYHLKLLFPILLQNLLNQVSSVKKSALQTLHIYFKYGVDKTIILDYLVNYGINNEEKAVRNEVFLSIPALTRSGFTEEQLDKIFISVLQAISNIENGDSTLPVVLCLEHIKGVMGEEHFQLFISEIEDSLMKLYTETIANSSLTRSTSIERNNIHSNQNGFQLPLTKNNKSDLDQHLNFGFVPQSLIFKLRAESKWQERTDACNELFELTSANTDVSIIKDNCREYLEYISQLVEDVNFNVSLTALNILHKVILKVGVHIRTDLEFVMKIFLKKLNDPKHVVKQINLRIALSLMHSLSPAIYIQNIIPILKNRNTRVREEIINMIIAALLSFPSSYFDLASLPAQLAFTLLDPKRQVRHASIECFAILAQQLGSGRLNPLVSAVVALETRKGGDGVLVAVQARLRRRTLPRINEEGLVQYALSVPTNAFRNENHAPDVSWVVAGSSNAGDTARQNSDLGDSMQRRHFSAGKKKLPWQNGSEFNFDPPPRKAVGSAPVRQVGNTNISSEPTNPVICDTWTSGVMISGKSADSSYLANCMARPKVITDTDSPLYPRSESHGSYFEEYKSKMKKLKAAGLQADSNIINSINPNMAFRNSLNNSRNSSVYKKTSVSSRGQSSSPRDSLSSPNGDTFSPRSPVERLTSPFDNVSPIPLSSERTNAETTPVPVKPTLAKSASKRKQRARMEAKKAELEFDKREEVQLSHTLPKTQHSGSLRRLSLDQQSPFPSRPTIHRTPSGQVVNRQIFGSHANQEMVEVSNLKSMKKLSNSSPIIYDRKTKPVGSPTELLSPLSVNMNRDHSPIIRTPRAKVLHSPVNGRLQHSPVNERVTSAGSSPRHETLQNTLTQTKGESSTSSKSLSDHKQKDEHPATPKLAKSAQEKLRKLKEERLRQSTDTALIIKLKKKNRTSGSLDLVSSDFNDFNQDNANIDLQMQNEEESRQKLKALEQEKEEKELKRMLRIKEKQERRMKEEERIWKANEVQRKLEDELFKKQELERTEILRKEQERTEIIRKEQIESKRLKKQQKELENHEHKILKENINKDAKSFNNSELPTNLEKMDWTPSGETDVDTYSWSVEPSLNKKKSLEVQGAAMFDRSSNKENLNDEIDETKGKTREFSSTAKENDLNNNLVDDEDLVIEGMKQRKSPRNVYPPKIANSPQVRRKNMSSCISPRSNSDVASPPRSFSEDIGKPLTNPQNAISNAINLLGRSSEDWECKCNGLVLIRRLTIHHANFLSLDFHTVVEAVLLEVKNLRSQVTRCALSCIIGFFTYAPKLVEPELEKILKIILPKAGDTNQFIRADVEAALNSFVNNIQPTKSTAAISAEVNHRNGLVRKVCAKALADICEKVGSSRLFATYKDILKVAAKLVVDSQPDTRYHGRRILCQLLDYPELERLLEKNLQSANLRPIQDIIENLRNKGLGDPPSGSATMRKSLRNPASMRSPATSRRSRGVNGNIPIGSTTEDPTSVREDSNLLQKPKRRNNNREMAVQPLKMEDLEKLDSSSWSDRYEGLDNFYDLVSMNPACVSAHAIKVFDKICPRLSDSNSKVNLYALQTLNRCIPILQNGMSSTMTIVIDGLKAPLSSKNESIYQAAKACLVTLTKYIDNASLLQPLVTAVQYGNARNKADLAESLAAIIPTVYARKPSFVNRQVLPLLWVLLSTSGSGVVTPGRANLQNAVASLCNILYQCLGEELINETKSKGNRAIQRLEAILQ